jgi:protein involved in polysaccharide export with SLBB domain
MSAMGGYGSVPRGGGSTRRRATSPPRMVPPMRPAAHQRPSNAVKAEIGIAKLRLKPGDVLLITVPDEWTVEHIARFEEWGNIAYGPFLNGARIIILSAGMTVSVAEAVSFAAVDIDLTTTH